MSFPSLFREPKLPPPPRVRCAHDTRLARPLASLRVQSASCHRGFFTEQGGLSKGKIVKGSKSCIYDCSCDIIQITSLDIHFLAGRPLATLVHKLADTYTHAHTHTHTHTHTSVVQVYSESKNYNSLPPTHPPPCRGGLAQVTSDTSIVSPW